MLRGACAGTNSFGSSDVVRILMVSPHPTYSPRGTPISVLNRCRALSALGHSVDLVTYGIGADVDVPRARWLRAPVPGIRSVKIGPSLAKIPLNMAVFLRAAVLAQVGSYDVIHTHEEAGILGALLRRTTRTPHVYDMGNDLAVVVKNYGLGERHPLTRLASWLERTTVRNAESVIAHFPVIAAHALELSGGRASVQTVPNVPLDSPAEEAITASFRYEWSPRGEPVILYTGSLEGYQGIPTLISAVALLRKRGIDLRLVVAGGREDQQIALKDRADSEGLSDTFICAGVIAQDDINSCLRAADVLVSARSVGTNTPLKIFSYMHSGRPIVATNIESHTQVLGPSCAFLADPTTESLADALSQAISTPDEGRARAAEARKVADERYSSAVYLASVGRAYEAVGARAMSSADIDAAVTLLESGFARRGT